MIEIALVLVIFALVGLLGWFDWNTRKERKYLLNALKAKDAQELAQMELADKVKLEVREPEKSSDLVSTDEMTDEQFKKNIEKELQEE